MTNLLIDSLVLEVVWSVSSVEPLLLLTGRVFRVLEPHHGALLLLLAVSLLPLALHTDAAAASTAGQAGVAGVAVLPPHQRGGQVPVSQAALTAQLCLVSAG